MIVNGFCKQVLRELPMEFAVEAQNLLGLSLEGRLAKVALGGFLNAANALAARRFDYAGAASSPVLNGAFARPLGKDDENDAM